jgi:hypothetical protein
MLLKNQNQFRDLMKNLAEQGGAQLHPVYKDAYERWKLTLADQPLELEAQVQSFANFLEGEQSRIISKLPLTDQEREAVGAGKAMVATRDNRESYKLVTHVNHNTFGEEWVVLSPTFHTNVNEESLKDQTIYQASRFLNTGFLVEEVKVDKDTATFTVSHPKLIEKEILQINLLESGPIQFKPLNAAANVSFSGHEIKIIVKNLEEANIEEITFRELLKLSAESSTTDQTRPAIGAGVYAALEEERAVIEDASQRAFEQASLNSAADAANALNLVQNTVKVKRDLEKQRTKLEFKAQTLKQESERREQQERKFELRRKEENVQKKQLEKQRAQQGGGFDFKKKLGAGLFGAGALGASIGGPALFVTLLN